MWPFEGPNYTLVPELLFPLNMNICALEMLWSVVVNAETKRNSLAATGCDSRECAASQTRNYVIWGSALNRFINTLYRSFQYVTKLIIYIKI